MCNMSMHLNIIKNKAQLYLQYNSEVVFEGWLFCWFSGIISYQ